MNKKYLHRIIITSFFILFSCYTKAQSLNLSTNAAHVCSGNAVMIYSGLQSTFDSYTWSWTDSGSVQLSFQSADSLLIGCTNNSANDTLMITVYLEATDSTGITRDSLEIPVLKLPLPSVNLQSDFAVCCDTGMLDMNIYGLGPGDSTGGVWTIYSNPHWLDGSYFKTELACFPSSSSVYVQYTYTDSNQCYGTDSIKITVNPLPFIVLDTLKVCQDTVPVNLSDEVVLSPTAAGLESWECIQCNGNDFSKMLEITGCSACPKTYFLDISPAVYSVQNPVTDTIILVYYYQNAYGCSRKDTTEMYISRVIDLKLSQMRPLCWDEGIIDLNQLTGINFTGGTWNVLDQTGYRLPSHLGGITDSSIINTKNSIPLISTSSVPGSFYLRYNLNSSNCSYIDTFLKINPLPNINFQLTDTLFCENSGKVLLNAIPSGGFWSASDANALINFNEFHPSLAENESIWIYYYYISPLTGCSAKDSMSVQIEPKPIIRLQKDTTIWVSYSLSKIYLEVKYETENLSTPLQWAYSTGVQTLGVTDSSILISYDLLPADSMEYKFFVLANASSTGVCMVDPATCMIKIIRNGLGVDDISLNGIRIYPNPANGFINVSSTAIISGSDATIFNISGEVVMQKTIYDTSLDISQLTPGLYYIRVTGDNRMYGRFVVQ